MAIKTRSVVALLAVGVAIGALARYLRQPADQTPRLVATQTFPRQIMGTGCELTGISASAQADRARAVLDRAEQCMRTLEAQMSIHLPGSTLSRFNAAPGGSTDLLTPDLLTVLSKAQRVWLDSDGTFDVTVGPLVQLWSRSAKAGRPPTDEEIAAGLKHVGMFQIRLDRAGATKLADGVCVDLGGIAKGYAVDLATIILKSAGLPGGNVNLGGNLRCFGATHEGGPWTVWIQHPFRADAACGKMLLGDAAVSTSGDYNRFHELAGRRYSHILNPRTGRPVEGAPSVTVVSLPTPAGPPSACLADGWSTALDVLGPEGLERLKKQPGLEAMMIVGTPDKHEVRMTAGFARLLAAGTTVSLE